MIRVSANFEQIKNVEIEVTIRATYTEWKELLELVDANRYPGSKFHDFVSDVVRKLERQISTIGGE